MNKIFEQLRKLSHIEPYYFYFFLLINLIPVLSFKFFPTVDGPAHLYNSNLIVELLKNPESTINDFFAFNHNINPNWTGHFLLSLFVSFLPGFLAEKIVLLIYLIGFPLSFRYLFKVLLIKNKYLIYLIFPFTYSFLFYYGFYNFNIGLIFFVFGVSFWIKYQNNLTIRNIVILTLFSSFIWLSHLFIFVIYLIVIFLFNIQYFIQIKRYDKIAIKIYLKNILLQLVALSFGLALMFKYILTAPIENAPSVYLSFKDIFISLKYIMPAKGINYSEIGILTKLLLYVFTTLILYFTLRILYSIFKKNKVVFRNNIWLFTTIIILLLLFILPDYKGASIGFISACLMLFFFIFFIIWLASQNIANWFNILIFLFVNYVNFALVLHNYRSVSNGCKLAEEIQNVSRYIKPNSTVLPILNTDNFIYGHISNYLGSDKPMIIFENYEASLNHFPLKWKYSSNHKLLFKNSVINNNCEFIRNPENKELKIDYIFVIDGENRILDKECSNKIDELLSLNFELLCTRLNKTLRLYKNKNCP